MFYTDDEDKDDVIKYLEPNAIKSKIMTVLKNMDQNKNGFIEINEWKDKLLAVYR